MAETKFEVYYWEGPGTSRYVCFEGDTREECERYAREHSSSRARFEIVENGETEQAGTALVETAQKVIERFEREYQELTDGQFGSVEAMPEVQELRAALEGAEAAINLATRNDGECDGKPDQALLDKAIAEAQARRDPHCEHCGAPDNLTDNLTLTACSGGAVGDIYLCRSSYKEHLEVCDECCEALLDRQLAEKREESAARGYCDTHRRYLDECGCYEREKAEAASFNEAAKALPV